MWTEEEEALHVGGGKGGTIVIAKIFEIRDQRIAVHRLEDLLLSSQLLLPSLSLLSANISGSQGIFAVANLGFAEDVVLLALRDEHECALVFTLVTHFSEPPSFNRGP